jgi:septal ring factor EnvC (AmiA/AmiB activator)
MEQRQNQREASADALADEQKRATALAGQATSLRDLIARMEAQSAIAAAAAAEAKQATEDAEAAGASQPPPHSLGNVDRLAPKVAFADAKGLLPLPVTGTEISGFGADDGLGGRTQGISLSTRDGAVVSSPSDGWVVYAGPFRSYGQLLIINAGGGYHVLLAGMERIDVQLGQFVLAGEPVAMMPSRKLASTEANVAGTQPVLYIEFRKDGASIDPAPWWAASNVEKAGG